MQITLLIQAWTGGLYADLVPLVKFRTLQRLVMCTPTNPAMVSPDTVSSVVGARQTGAKWRIPYDKSLPKSAVLTRTWREGRGPMNGYQGSVTGYQLPSLRGHSLLKVAGEVASGDRQGLDHYQVLERW